MKSIVKLALAFALGILVTVTVILPEFQTSDKPEESDQTSNIQAEIEEAVDAAVMEAFASVKKIAEQPAVQTVQETEPAKVPVTPEPEVPVQEAEAASDLETEREPTPAPTTQPVPTTQLKPAEPECFYEDGKKYAYINGIKSHITDEPSVQLDYYDWENDPAGQIPGCVETVKM